MSPRTLDISFPLIIGTDLYPMEKLGGCRSQDGRARRGQSIDLAEARIVQGELIADLARRGFEAWRFDVVHPHWGRASFTSLDVTYLESYRHIAAKGPLPRQVLDRRGGDSYRAVVVHVDMRPGEQILPQHLAAALKQARAGDALIVDAAEYTDRCLEQGGGVIDFSDYNVRSPFFHADAMKAIIDTGVSLIAGNFPSYSNPQGGTGVSMLKLYWQTPANLILAPLLRLGQIEADVVTLRVNPMSADYPSCALPAVPTVEWF